MVDPGCMTAEDINLNKMKVRLARFGCPVFFVQQRPGLAIRSVSVGCDPEPENLTFPLYSVTKTLISFLAFKMMAENRMSLEQRLIDLLDLDSAWLEGMTIEHLLTHRSGLGDYGYVDEYQEAVKRHPSEPFSEEKLIDLVFQQGPIFPPNSDFRYSNIGYLFLRRVIEKIYGLPFVSIVHQEFIEKLSLNNTFVAEDLDDFGSITFKAMPSKRLEVNDVRKVLHPKWVSHGLVISNAREILSVFDFIFNEGTLGAQFYKKLVTPRRLPFSGDYFDPHYGYGVLGDPKSKLGRYLGHDGSGPGYSVAVFNVCSSGEKTNYCLAIGKEGLSGKDELASLLQHN